MAIETTVLSEDVRQIVDTSPNVACLPRWSSAPASLDVAAPVDRAAAPDDVDAISPTLEPTVRSKLQKLFSVDVGMLERPHEHHHRHHHHQQQQQQSQGSSTTTRL